LGLKLSLIEAEIFNAPILQAELDLKKNKQSGIDEYLRCFIYELCSPHIYKVTKFADTCIEKLEDSQLKKIEKLLQGLLTNVCDFYYTFYSSEERFEELPFAEFMAKHEAKPILANYCQIFETMVDLPIFTRYSTDPVSNWLISTESLKTFLQSI
jgi:hypothetical protein